jgi:hypothetical protein
MLEQDLKIKIVQLNNFSIVGTIPRSYDSLNSHSHEKLGFSKVVKAGTHATYPKPGGINH